MQFEKTFARLTFEDRRTDRMTRSVEKQENKHGAAVAGQCTFESYMT